MSAPRSTLTWFVLGAILLATVAAYHGVIDNGFVLDDYHTVRDNPSLQSFAFVGRWLSSPYAASGTREHQNYRPILVASYTADYALGGDKPAGFHATNLAIHLGVVLLTFVLGRRLWGDDLAALCAAGLVALHPINAEAVNYITARSSSLMTLFVLAAVWASDTSARAGASGRWWLVVSYGLGLAAFGTKEVAIVLPALIIAWDRATHDPQRSWRTTLMRSLPWWILAGGFLLARTWVLSTGHGTAVTWIGGTTSQGALFAIKIYLASLGHWIWPAGLAVDHAWPLAVGTGEAVLLVLGAAAVGAGTIVTALRARRVGWCFAWFWATLAPAGVLPFLSRVTLYQDHRVYLSGVALGWVVGYLAAVVVRRFPFPLARAGLAAAALAFIVAAGRADLGRTGVWIDSAHLWDDVLAKYPGSLLGHSSKGLHLMNEDRLEEARGAFESALRLAPGFSEGYGNLGLLYARLEDWERAAAAFETALKINPHYGAATLNLSKVYERTGRPDRALELYDQLLRDDPDNPGALARSAFLLEGQGRPEEAEARYRRVLVVDPGHEKARLALGGIALRAGRWAEAHAAFEMLAGRYPDSYPIRFNLAAALDGLNRVDDALEAYRAAAALEPGRPDAYFRMGVLQSKRGRWADAAEWYEQALARDARHFSSHMNLALVAEQLGDTRRAAAHYRAFVATAPAEATYEAFRARAREAMVRLGGSRG